jgi:ADP-ribose pyrophosphatase YjhB (NUDIX family)
MAFTYDWPMAANTATMVIIDGNNRRVLLGKRDSNKSADAFPGAWCLPGGFLNVGTERLVNTARRETLEEVGLDIPENNWHQFYTDDEPGMIHAILKLLIPASLLLSILI